MSLIKFFTVGYGNFVTREEFIKALVDKEVTFVVDVRRSVGRRRKGFGAALGYELIKSGIGKIDMPNLSNPYLDMDGYSAHIEGNEGIDRITDLVSRQTGLAVVAIMCVCENLKECHRTVVADHVVRNLVEKGYTAGYEDIGK